jgi:hypothetical protein
VTRYIATPPNDVTVLNGDGSARPLPLRKDVYHHSNDFSWGYGGSGPTQLALALLVHALQDVKKAKCLYQEFKWRYVARLGQDDAWEISRGEVRAIVAEIEATNKA